MLDWAKIEKYPRNEIQCRCGAIFHDHAMFDGARMVSRHPCPKCGKSDELRRVSSGPERMSLGADDIGSV